MIGFLAFLPTVSFVPHLLYVLVLLYIFAKKRSQLKIGKLRNFVLLLTIITFSIANNLFHTENIKVFTDYIPFIFLILISYLAALNFEKSDAKVLISLIAFEAIVCLAESYYGVSTFFTSLDAYRTFGGNGLLYFNRTLGLSQNSSTAALKFMIALLLINFYNLKGKYISICYVLIGIGIVLTFNRTVLVALVFFYTLYWSKNILLAKASQFKILGIVVLLTSISLILMFFSDEISARLIGQFTRNTGSVELTGRTQIWYLFSEYIQQHFLVGNGSYKYMLHNYIEGRIFHAHNSFLQILATHGIFISLIYLVLTFININSKNIIFVFTIVIYSLSQYGIFWGVSLLDIIFFLFLFSENKNKYIHSHTNLFNNEQQRTQLI